MDTIDGPIEHRYDVKRVNDEVGKHDECPYFVLDPIHDVIAREALKHYMGLARKMEFIQLADGISQLLWATATEHEKAMREKTEMKTVHSFIIDGNEPMWVLINALQEALDELSLKAHLTLTVKDVTIDRNPHGNGMWQYLLKAKQ